MLIDPRGTFSFGKGVAWMDVAIGSVPGRDEISIRQGERGELPLTDARGAVIATRGDGAVLGFAPLIADRGELRDDDDESGISRERAPVGDEAAQPFAVLGAVRFEAAIVFSLIPDHAAKGVAHRRADEVGVVAGGTGLGRGLGMLRERERIHPLVNGGVHISGAVKANGDLLLLGAVNGAGEKVGLRIDKLDVETLRLRPAGTLLERADQRKVVAFHERSVVRRSHRVGHVRLAAHEPDFAEEDILDLVRGTASGDDERVGSTCGHGVEFYLPTAVCGDRALLRLHDATRSIFQCDGNGFPHIPGAENRTRKVALEHHAITEKRGQRNVCAHERRDGDEKTKQRGEVSAHGLLEDLGSP